MSYNFIRKISNLQLMQSKLNNDVFLKKVKDNYISKGKALLTFRNDEATVYYNGNQLCNTSFKLGKTPQGELTVYEKYLPLIRSAHLGSKKSSKNVTEEQWRKETGINNYSFEDVLPEILDNISKDSSPESTQVSKLYKFSPLNLDAPAEREIILLDVEAAFAKTGEKTERIDAVFYHTKEHRLMFIEVKRLSDGRIQEKDGNTAEVIKQLSGYKKVIDSEKQNIVDQYNNVIKYYNDILSKNKIPLMKDCKDPLLGLLLVEFTSQNKDKEQKKKAEEILAKNGMGIYSIGNAENVKDETLAKIYSTFLKLPK